jgi:hypothetical protein
MSKHGRARTIALPWRRVCGALPALALIGGGIALISLNSPGANLNGASASKVSPAIVVPSTALTMPPVLALPEGGTPGLVLPDGTLPGSSTLVALDSQGIPARALEAYRRAVSLIDSADPACHIDWPLVAAIGRVESNHARFDGNQLDASGVARPGIIGMALDGSNGTARITDTDGGSLDRDTTYDRAVGPMQFIPGTWRVVGSDADGDGVKNPQDMVDAATATAIYLCSGPGDLTRSDDLSAAIMRYNASDSYVRTVIAIADAYRHGVTELPASDLPAARSASSSSGAASPSAKPASASASRKTAAPAGSTPAPAAQQPVSAPAAPVVTAPSPAPPPLIPTLPIPVIPAPIPTPGSMPLTQQVCTISPLGVRICTVVPLAPTSSP